MQPAGQGFERTLRGCGVFTDERKPGSCDPVGAGGVRGAPACLVEETVGEGKAGEPRCRLVWFALSVR